MKIDNIYHKVEHKLKLLSGHLIVIEGNISSGKTTLGTKLEKYLNENGIKAKYIPEYIDEYFLAKYIANMQKYAFTFQYAMLLIRIQTYIMIQELISKGYCVIMDRSFIGDLAFAILQYDKKFINDDEWKIYIKKLTSSKKLEPSCILYLDVKPEIVKQRNIKRNNKCEVDGYDISYFIDLDNAYKKAEEYSNVKMCHYDYNEDKKDLTNEDLDKVLIFILENIYLKN